MEHAPEIITVAQVIQQAVAPVFLLTGVGAVLSVLSVRLARVIDRFRVLDTASNSERATHAIEIDTLILRARWIHWAISLCTTCALLICIVIAALFIGSELGKDPSTPIAVLFIAAMLALTTGLLCFLREIALSTNIINFPKSQE
ncbi:DUF2721 domain-containing protein [Sideroxydans lithotrophicus]|uniref:DUF2721 domain-containing protein n=1 Tax=Sideroxydans lithotrophicus (strain ES-1) TaxID=580332 RepID=D5CRG7_SIDLE|nr:DUF2721 domain-containing protein [Sideroxydans lithotrophicus]ADE11553.1 conserved hypothetical protein [Sideroxydans lithotrophicus ES-1]